MPRSFLIKKHGQVHRRPDYGELDSQTAIITPMAAIAVLPLGPHPALLGAGACPPGAGYIMPHEMPGPGIPAIQAGCTPVTAHRPLSPHQPFLGPGKAWRVPSPEAGDTFAPSAAGKTPSSPGAAGKTPSSPGAGAFPTMPAPVGARPADVSDAPGRKAFSCKHCDKEYLSLGALKMHIRTHTLPCVCKICGKAFSRPWLLQGHVRTHTGEKPFSCQHCRRAFADRSNLRAHLQTHSEVKRYQCKACAKTFSRMSLLSKHGDSGSCTAH
uniref:zinc finger protein SNAI3 n=1 Tax=Myxine glutinosa TaxID=7769 RepID=UPI00358FD06D